VTQGKTASSYSNRRAHHHHQRHGAAERRHRRCLQSQELDSGTIIKGTVASDERSAWRPHDARLLLALALCCLGQPALASARIKDIVSVQGVRANQLVGLRLGHRLNGTATRAQLAVYPASPAVDARQHGHQCAQRAGAHAQHRGRHRHHRVAGFAGKGSRIDVTVSSLGDATSLTGGSLMLTPLMVRTIRSTRWHKAPGRHRLCLSSKLKR